MTRTAATLIGNLIGGEQRVLNTTSLITCYPAASDASAGLTVSSGTAVYDFGSWVQFIGGAAGSSVTSEFAVIGVTVETAHDASSVSFLELGALQIGTGSAGNQTVIETLYLGQQYFIAGFYLGIAPTARHQVYAFRRAMREDYLFAGRRIDECAHFFASVFI